MNEKIHYKDFKNLLKESRLSESYPYLESFWDAYTYYMPLSCYLAKKMAEKIIQGETDYFKIIENEATTDYSKDGSVIKRYKLKTCDYPKNTCEIEGFEIPAEILFKKSAYDFIHWARVCFELLTQLINSSLLKGENVDVEDYSIKQKVSSKLNEKKEYQKLHEMMLEIRDDNIYNYICDFDNCMKHVRLISSNVNTVQISFSKQPTPKFVFEEFSHNKNSHCKVDALKKIEEIEGFMSTSVYQLLLKVKNIIEVELSQSDE